MTVRLRGRLPAEELNGLGTTRIEEALVREPRSKRIVVAVVTVYERRDHGDGEFEPTVEIEHVELLEGKLRERGVKVLQAAHNVRTGSRTLFSTDEEDAEHEALPPTTPPVPGPRFLFEPGAESKWWMVYRDDDGTLLARTGPIGVRADLTLGRTYTLEQIDAFGDDDLSISARELVHRATDREFDEAAPAVDEGALAEAVAGAIEDDERSQYASEDVGATVALDEDESAAADEIPGPAFSDRKEQRGA